MPTKVPVEFKTVASQEDKRPWWEKHESNAEKREREQKEKEVFCLQFLVRI